MVIVRSQDERQIHRYRRYLICSAIAKIDSTHAFAFPVVYPQPYCFFSMARTKQSAKRTTGVHAPRQSLWATAAVNDSNSPAAPSADRENSDATVGNLAVGERSETSSDVSCTTDIFNNVFNAVFSQYCLFCREGGVLIGCDTEGCGRQMCYSCLPELQNISAALLDNLRVECYTCQSQRESKKITRFIVSHVFCRQFKTVSGNTYLLQGLWHNTQPRYIQPYFPNGLKVAYQGYMNRQLEYVFKPTLVLSFRLSSLPEAACPSSLAKRYLDGYYVHWPQDIVYHEIQFNLPDESKRSLRDHSTKLQALQKEIKKKAFSRVLIFINTHSAEGDGGLCHKDGASLSADDVRFTHKRRF
ncbi:hypothetical protein K474DRAFT_1295221 [Panus rudis PR-1116 ss-1]|nr:hypothetical protein K474DRAFT_1295221 [Panus rudis PR-1116 ss-1]